MALTDEQIRAIMEKEGSSKTILVATTEIEEIIQKHLQEGWKLHKKTEIGDKTKLTFIK